MTYRFFSDPGHGWLEVPKKELAELGIAEKISAYSYQSRQMAYLEEDCDLAVFLRAKGFPVGQVAKFWPQVVEIEANQDSPVRNMPSYQVPA